MTKSEKAADLSLPEYLPGWEPDEDRKESPEGRLFCPPGKIAIQRLPIHLPGFTTIVKYEPRYVFPLFKALWKFRDPKAPVHNSEDSVRILASYPHGATVEQAWLVIDEDMAVESERARLSAQFGRHPNGELLFDVVYPGDNFETAFNAARKPSLAMTATAAANPAIEELAALDSIGQGLATKLFEKGIRSVREVALAADDELAKIVGKTRAAKAKAHAESMFETSAEA